MRDEDTNENENGNTDEPAAEDRLRGHLWEVGVRPLSDLLGSLIEVNVSRSPLPPEDAIERSSVDENHEDSRERVGVTGREQPKRVRLARANGALIDTRFDGDEFVLTADLPGTRREDLSVGIATPTNELLIEKEGAILKRVTLPWASVEPVRAWYDNGILEVRVRPANL